MAVGFGSSQNIESLTRYQEANGLTWTFAEAPDSMVRDYRVTTQSTKVGIGADGVIKLKAGYGTNPDSFWQGWLKTLTQ